MSVQEDTVAYRTLTQTPPLVKRALNLAEQMRARCFCSREAGRLLQLLTSQLQSGVIGEVGAGCGVASAWIVSALLPGTSFFTVEGDPVGAAAVQSLFEHMLNVRVVQGDWRDFLNHWRFGLLYAGPGSARAEEPELFVHSLRLGGLIVLDGLTPLKLRSASDPLRDFWLNDPRLLSIEVTISESESVILATLVA